MTKYRDLATIIVAGLLMLAAGVGVFLFFAGCSHPAAPITPNRAAEYVILLDKNARCEDWRRGLGPDSALCQSGDALFWCVAPFDAKPRCDLLYAPPKPEAVKPPEAKPDATNAATKPKEPTP